MSDPRPVLDHGFVKLVEFWGSDERIIESARMSTSGSFRGWDQDARLLSYLWKNNHYSPFEMAGLTIEVQAPIFVFREWHRHRTQSYNELSARYTELPDLFYIPSIERLTNGGQSRTNKQGSGVELDPGTASVVQDTIHEASIDAYRTYQQLLVSGIAREIARLVIPVNVYSRMRASTNLRNWLAFLDLRLGEGVQWEMKEYAKVVGEIVGELFPRTWELFKEGQDA